MTSDRGKFTDNRMTDDLRRAIFNAVEDLLVWARSETVDEDFNFHPGERFLDRVLREFLNKNTNEIQNEMGLYGSRFPTGIEDEIIRGKPSRILELINIIISHGEDDNKKSVKNEVEEFTKRMCVLFEKHGVSCCLDTSQSPFRFVFCDNKEQKKSTIVPRSSVKAGRAAQKVIEKIREADMDSAATHLHKAADLLKAREYADSIRESIHAVESVACAIDPQPEAKNNLSKALNSLENNGLLKHADIKAACRKLYDFTNKVRGIRHAREARNPPDVGLEEAEFMLGACESFAAYLVSKHRQQPEKQEADG